MVRLREREINFEGFLQYGGLAGRDMAALAQGIREVVKDDYIEGRVKLLQELGDKFDAYGVPYLHPVGGHALYINANRVYPNIPQSEFPALVFACQLYLESGVRCCEMGSLCKGFDPDTGEQLYAAIDLCRLPLAAVHIPPLITIMLPRRAAVLWRKPVKSSTVWSLTTKNAHSLAATSFPPLNGLNK